MAQETSYLLVVSRFLRGLAILCFTAAVFPLAVAVCLPCYVLATVVQAIKRQILPISSEDKCILILSAAKAKALHIARLFKAEGYTIVMAENRLYPFVGASFSKHVDAFYYLPIPKDNPQGYQSAILEIVKRHKPSLLVPLDPRTVDYDTEVFSKLPTRCVPLACQADVFKELDHKGTFMAALDRNGIRAPRSRLVTTKKEAFDFLKGKSKDYVFKSISYDDAARTNIHPPEDLKELDEYLTDSGVSPTKPYVIQEKLEGPELCSVSLIVGKHLISHTVGFSAPVYQKQKHEGSEDVVQWIEEFIDRYPGKLVGWFTFDLMKSPVDGRYYPLECNPRLGTYFMLFTSEDGTIPLLLECLALESASDREAKRTSSSQLERKMVPSRKQIYYLMNILWEIISNPFSVAGWQENVGILLRGNEAVFSVMDPLPFLALNFLQMPALIVRFMLHSRPWNIVDYNIGSLKIA